MTKFSFTYYKISYLFYQCVVCVFKFVFIFLMILLIFMFSTVLSYSRLFSFHSSLLFLPLLLPFFSILSFFFLFHISSLLFSPLLFSQYLLRYLSIFSLFSFSLPFLSIFIFLFFSFPFLPFLFLFLFFFLSLTGGHAGRSLPPNGLQLTLNVVDQFVNSSAAAIRKPARQSDTLVMQNLGK